MINLAFLSNIKGIDHDIEGHLSEETTVLWGVAPTGDIHLGYAPFFLLLKKLKIIGCKVIPFIANYHAYLDSYKTTWDDIHRRAMYYKEVFRTAGLYNFIESKDLYCTSEYIE